MFKVHLAIRLTNKILRLSVHTQQGLEQSREPFQVVTQRQFSHISR